MFPRFNLPKLFQREVIVYDVDIRKHGATRVLVTMLTDRRISIHSMVSDARFQSYNAWTFPLEEAPKFYEKLSLQYNKLKLQIDDVTKEYIQRYLKRESTSFFYATAEDSDDMPHTFGPIETRPFQRAALKYLEFSDDNKILALDMGLGKTAVSLMFTERRNLRTLFITKASLIHNLDREIKKLTGKSPIRLSGKRPDNSTMQAFLTQSNQYFILNYEVIGTIDNDGEPNMNRPWVDAINMMSQLGFIQCIVADEAHNCRNIRAKRTQALMHMNVKYKIPMTGTPIVNRVKELYPILHWIAPEQFDSEQSFLNAHDKGDGTAKNAKELQKVLLPYMFRRSKKDVLKDLPPINRILHNVELSLPHKHRYTEALKFFFLQWDGTKKDINSTLAQLTRLRQVIADAKSEASVEYVRDFLEESDEKILVFSYFVAPVTNIALHLECDCIYGDVPYGDRMKMVDKFNSDPSTRVLVIQMQTGQEGLNLTGAKNILFNDVGFVSTDIEQAEARCYGRLNDVHGATSIQLNVENSVDALLNGIIRHKMKLIESIIDGTNDYAKEQTFIFQDFVNKLEAFRPSSL